MKYFLQGSVKRTISNYIKTTLDKSCIDKYNYKILPSKTWYTTSKMVRAGIRYPGKWEKYKNKDNIIRNLFEVEFSVELKIKKKNKELDINLLTRIEYSSKSREAILSASPWLQSESCPGTFILEEICGCLK